MQINTLALVEVIAAAIQTVIMDVYAQPEPAHFFHYTRVPDKIWQSGNIWGTRLADQEDPSELKHGLQWVTEAVEEVSRAPKNAFNTLVLDELYSHMIARREWTYITCFCGDGGSLLHSEKFGEYKVRFRASQLNRLRCDDFRASIWLQPVVYDHKIQREAVFAALQGVVDGLCAYAVGEPVGPWVESMAKRCARDAGQLLLRLIVGFKREEFKKEQEWRLVYYPRLALADTAPLDADKDFSCAVKGSPVKHIELRPIEVNSFEQTTVT